MYALHRGIVTINRKFSGPDLIATVVISASGQMDYVG